MPWFEQAGQLLLAASVLGGGLLVWPGSRLFLSASSPTRRRLRIVFFIHLLSVGGTLAVWAALLGFGVRDAVHFGVFPYALGALSFILSFLVCAVGAVES